MLERGNIPHQWRKLTALEHWFNTLLIRIVSNIKPPSMTYISYLIAYFHLDPWVLLMAMGHDVL